MTVNGETISEATEALIRMFEEQIDTFRAELSKCRADAVLCDFVKCFENGEWCRYCKKFRTGDGCTSQIGCGFEWRGVCAENGGAE